ncbi:lipid-binding protein [Aestuariibaculum sp. YM273]|uniref:lipid-binding protein n=1 Tax=Aestuariibaculum sp. YM273 TaxID=3070659 RepID=UPI0027DD79C6|nr:lipid-binding protein [Aestuariibaculum sp. YM273]WMI66097.1 lipid-binding protein [Aestuariibaculum sp. YM273]
MKTIKQYIAIPLLTLFLVTSFVSCDEVEDPNPGGTAVEKMAGDWYVQTFVGENLALDYQLISTYNTAANTDEMWVDDHQHIWWFKSKTPVNISDMSFAGTDLESSVDGYDITVTITNGKVTQGDTETSGGNMTDGISFDIEFSDDPGTIYTIKGYKRTGFAEDEH